MYINNEDCYKTKIVTTTNFMDTVLKCIARCTRDNTFMTAQDKFWFHRTFFKLCTANRVGATCIIFLTLQELYMLRDCLTRARFILSKQHSVDNIINSADLTSTIKCITSAMEYDGE